MHWSCNRHSWPIHLLVPHPCLGVTGRAIDKPVLSFGDVRDTYGSGLAQPSPGFRECWNTHRIHTRLTGQRKNCTWVNIPSNLPALPNQVSIQRNSTPLRAKMPNGGSVFTDATLVQRSAAPLFFRSPTIPYIASAENIHAKALGSGIATT